MHANQFPSEYVYCPSFFLLNLVVTSYSRPCLMCRKQPPDHILQKAKNTNKYFKLISAAPHPESGHTSGNASVYQFLTPEENEAVSFSILLLLLFVLFLFLYLFFNLCMSLPFYFAS